MLTNLEIKKKPQNIVDYKRYKAKKKEIENHFIDNSETK